MSPTSVESYSEDNQINVSPNPSTGKFLFSNIEKESTIEIFDALGKSILKATSKNNSCSFDLSDKAKGVYFFSISNKNKNNIDGKIIVQ